MDKDDLIARARLWAEQDPDPVTKAELLALIASPDIGKTDLADRFAGSLEFGTAGLRGVIGAGPNRMNRAVVLCTTWGLAHELLATFPDAADKGVVIGYDGRRYSKVFAEDTALVLAAAGVPAHLFEDLAPTPLTAYAITRLGAVAGVMVTASHNPAEYNGYKAYWRNGAQIIPPTDEKIAARIALAPPPRQVLRLEMEDARKGGLVKKVPNEVILAYLAAVKELAVHADGDRSFPIVYTPMHGVGDVLARKALAQAGFTSVTSVPEQQKPDGAFPTVAFPNPEEKGAMDLAFALGRKQGAKLILANDPDADRLAVALPRPDGQAPGFVQLTGNQVGVVMGHYLLTERPKTPGEKPVVLASIVSSPMLGAIAAALGVHYDETLTGFKWIANLAMALEADGYTFLFGYEEALGYTVGDVVRDKDGVSAAAIVAEITAVLAARGKTILGELEAIYRRYGLYVSSQVNITRRGAAGAAEISALMDRLRKDHPRKVGDKDVLATRDYQTGERVDSKGGTTKLTLPKSNVLTFELAGGSRIIARPSGTEPKVKFYFDVREEITASESLSDAEARANGVMKRLADAFVALAG